MIIVYKDTFIVNKNFYELKLNEWHFKNVNIYITEDGVNFK